MMRTLLAAAALALVVPGVALADGDPNIKFERYKLANGLEVILAPDPAQPLVSVNIWYHVGSGNEVPGKSGFAHLFEHMMFQGSKNTGKDAHFEILKRLGANDINGTTNTDRTNYFEVVPSNQVETALWLESDRMSHLLEMLDSKELANQIDVVRNEKRQNYDNQPYRKALFAMYEALYPEGHPYRHLTIGLHEDLERASVDDVKAFYKTWYVPANATLAIVGDFDSAAIKKLVDKWFGTFPASAKPKLVMVPAPTVAASTVTVEDSFAKLRQITFAWHSPANFADGDAELDFIADALTREGTGRLYKSLVYDKQLATAVRASQGGAVFSGTFTVTITLRTGASLDEAKQIALAEIGKLTKEPLGPQEMARVVAAQESNKIWGLENLNSRANLLQEYNQYFGDPGRISWDLDRYRKATAEKIRQAAAKYLAPEHMVTVITNPAGGGK